MARSKKYPEPPPPVSASEPQPDYSRPLNFHDIWIMFQETKERFMETDSKFRETDKILTEKFRETDKMLSEKFRETDKKMKELQELFTSQWGRLIESLVEGDLVRLLNERNIPVNQTSERKKGSYQGKSYEFDIVAENGQEVVFVEVKTTLKSGDVKAFIKKLSQIKTWMPKYASNTIYGAVAFLKANAGSEVMAEKHGLFVIRATGKSASIINCGSFEPKKF